jgi:hypothetical protein
MFKTQIMKDIIELRRGGLQSKQGKELMRKHKLMKARKALKQKLSVTLKEWDQVRPRMAILNSSMIALLKDTENLVIYLSEPLYLIELRDTKELVICRQSELKKVGDEKHS